MPYPPCTVTVFWLKNRDRCPVLASGNATSLYCRAVGFNYKLPYVIVNFLDFLIFV
jgi:hypothetical protein